MKKKILGSAALVALAALSLSSCGGSASDEKTIVFYHTMGDNLQNVLETAVTTFETKYPGWKIEHSQVGGYDDVKKAIIGDLGAGTQPDIAYCYADHVAQYITTGKVLNVAPYINSTENHEYVDANGETQSVAIGYTADEVSKFISGYYNEGYATNFANYDKYGYGATDMLTMPYSKSTEVLYYNIDALIELGYYTEENGVKTAKVPQTWAELWEIAAAAKAKYPKSTPLGYDSEANWFITMCEQNGWGYTSAQEPHYLFNNENTAGWLEDLAEKFDAGLFTTKTIYNGAYTSNLFKKGAAEGSIFVIGSSGGASNQATTLFKWGVAPCPGSEVNGKVNSTAISQGPNLCLFKSESSNAEEKQIMTWLFVKELLAPQFQCAFSMESGYNPMRVDAFEIDEYVEFLADKTNIKAVTANVAKDMADIYFTSPAFNGSSTARDQVGSAFVYAVTGQKPAAKALKDAANACGA